MAYKIGISQLQGSTLDILNTIRQYASTAYQDAVPEISQYDDIPKIGQTIYGYPALANEFIGSLINRIAFVLIRSAQANNNLAPLKKGMLSMGETVEEAYIELVKAKEFKQELAEKREFKRNIADVRTAFHAQNWKAQYCITVSREELAKAFRDENGLNEFIMRIVNTVVESANLDEYLLMKYLLLKGIVQGKVKAVGVDATSWTDMAEKFRAYSNRLEFLKTDYNLAGVHTSTKKADQYIIMDADFEAGYGVNVLASAFNKSEVDYTANRLLIDDFATFDNGRFSDYAADSNGFEALTDTELGTTANVKAMLIDKEFVQVYDTLIEMTDVRSASGLYTNYFYNVWKIFDTSPFANAICFVPTANVPSAPATIKARLDAIDDGNNLIYTIRPVDATTTTKELEGGKFVHGDEDDVEAGVAIHPFGAYIIPKVSGTPSYPDYIWCEYMGNTYKGAMFQPETSEGVTTYPKAGDTVTLTKQA